MSAVSEWIVREYFESFGFFVNQPRKFTVPGRSKRAAEEVDLLVVNPRVGSHSVPSSMVWTGADLKGVARAIVGIRGWHSERFYASTFEQTPEILRFAEDACIRYAAGLLGSEAMARILCLPRLPASGELKEKTILFLKSRGIDGVISFRTILAELAQGVETKKHYEKSDLLQIIRLLKNYDFLKDSQLELFTRKRRRRKSRKADSKLRN